MGLSYIAQSRRFLIQEGYGCEFAADASVPGILLMLVWPLLLSVISSVYGGRCEIGQNIPADLTGIAIYYFVSKRLEFRTLLRSSNSGLDTGQFIRLLCLASVDIAVAVPMDIYIITRNVANLLPYSWSEIHHDWSTVLTVPASYWLTNPQLVIDVALWRYLLPMLGFALFVLIGMTEESIGEYTRVALRIWHKIPGTQRRQ
jgi:pheromone a factor receptor